MTTTPTPTVTITRVSHTACDNCGDHDISLRDPDTLYLDAQCAASVIQDDDLWAEFKDAPTGPKSVQVPLAWVIR